MPSLVGLILYGSGLRLLEALTLRVKDVDLERGELRLRRAKGARDRVTVLSEMVRPLLREHLQRVQRLHQRDLAEGAGYFKPRHWFESEKGHNLSDFTKTYCRVL